MQKLPRIVILRTGNMKFYKGIKPDAERQFRDELRLSLIDISEPTRH